MISCSCGDGDGADWWWFPPEDPAPLTTRRSRKCCSCGSKVAVGEVCYRIDRARQASTAVEERIYGDDDIGMTPWWWCEKCGDMYHNITEAGFCVSLEKGVNIVEEWKELQRGLQK